MYTLAVTLETAVDNTDSHKVHIVALELLLIKLQDPPQQMELSFVPTAVFKVKNQLSVSIFKTFWKKSLESAQKMEMEALICIQITQLQIFKLRAVHSPIVECCV